jgi:hypothetical protein
MKDVIGQEAVLDIGHLYVHGDAVVAGPLLEGCRRVREASSGPSP